MDYFNNISLFNIKNFRSKFIIFISIICFLVFPEQTFAKDINVTGYYGFTKCTEIQQLGYDTTYSDCSYQNSNILQNTNTTYTMLNKATKDFSGSVTNYDVFTSLFLFGYFEFIQNNYYTLNFYFDNGSYVTNNLSLTNSDSVSFGYFSGSDYVDNQGLSDLTYSTSYDSTLNKGYISITFKATKNTSSFRFIVNHYPLFRNYSFDYNQGVRVYLLNAIEEEDNSNALLGQITNQNNTIINQNQQQINQQQQTNDKLDDILDDEPLSEEVIDDFFEGIGANFTTDTPISDLILMPFTLLEAYSNGISGICSNFDLGSLLGTNLSMPCIDLESILGSNIWRIIDMLFSLFMFYEIAMLIVSIFDSVTSLDDSFQLLYTPRHGDMSRVGRGHSRGLY